MQWPYGSYHRANSSYGFNQYEDFHDYHRNNNGDSDCWSYPVDSYEQPYYDSVCDEDHYNSSALQEIRELMPKFRNQNQKILETLQSMNKQLEQLEQEKFNQEVIDFMHGQKKVNLMILEQLQDIRAGWTQLNQMEEEEEEVDKRSGGSTFTGTYDDEEGDEALQGGMQNHEPFMPAESQPQPNPECGQLGLQTNDTLMSHPSDTCPDSDMNLEGKEVMISPECLYDLEPLSHRLEELGGDLTFTPSRHDGFDGSNTSVIFCQPSFPFDPGDEHCQVFLVNSPIKAQAECLFTCANRNQIVLGSNFSVARRPMWIHFPFDVKHYRWSEYHVLQVLFLLSLSFIFVSMVSRTGDSA